MNAQTEITDEEIDQLWENCSDPCQPEMSIHLFARVLIAHLTKPDAGGGEAVTELLDELVRVRDVMLRECGIGVVNEVVLAKYTQTQKESK